MADNDKYAYAGQNKYEAGSKVAYDHSKIERDRPATFVSAYGEDECLLEADKDDDYQDERFFTIHNHHVQPYYESQSVEVNYKDIYNALECALNQGYPGYPGLAALPELMKDLGFEVPEDNLIEANDTHG